MTVDRKENITIPKWLVIILIPLFLGGLGGYVSSQVTMARVSEQINANREVTERNRQDLEKKANQTEFEIIKAQLNRIEVKIDNHMTSTNGHNIK